MRQLRFRRVKILAPGSQLLKWVEKEFEPQQSKCKAYVFKP